MNARIFLCLALLLIPVTADAIREPADDQIAEITAAAQKDDFAWQWLSELCDLIGPRLSGSEAYDKAAEFSVASFKEVGFDRVWTEPSTVPHWTRGQEWARITTPVDEPMIMSGLGTSPGTPQEGLEAEVMVVHDYDELQQRSEEAKGRIVLFNPEWKGYGSVARYRTGGPTAAAKLGAVAALVRSATGRSLATPHTGVTNFDDDAPHIPAAAVSVEDADRIDRLIQRGEKVTVRLYMEAENHPDVVQSTVIAEVTGRELPDEIVVVGCHLDSWDVGTGAHDDGAGCAIVAGAARLLLNDKWRPRRSVHVVLFASEEFGGHSGRDYLELHRHELHRYVAALESDSGSFEPAGFSAKTTPEILDRLGTLATPLEELGASEVRKGWAGVDIGPIVEEGVPGIAHRTHHDPYFDYHHSPADTLDKVDPEILAKNVAVVAGLVWAIAEDPVSLRETSREFAR